MTFWVTWFLQFYDVNTILLNFFLVHERFYTMFPSLSGFLTHVFSDFLLCPSPQHRAFGHLPCMKYMFSYSLPRPVLVSICLSDLSSVVPFLSRSPCLQWLGWQPLSMLLEQHSWVTDLSVWFMINDSFPVASKLCIRDSIYSCSSFTQCLAQFLLWIR